MTLLKSDLAELGRMLAAWPDDHPLPAELHAHVQQTLDELILGLIANGATLPPFIDSEWILDARRRIGSARFQEILTAQLPQETHEELVRLALQLHSAFAILATVANQN